MNLNRWGAYATALLFMAGLAGCTVTEMFSSKTEPVLGPAEDHFISGSLEIVSAHAEGALRQLGVQYNAAPEGAGVRVHCTTQSGKKFDLVLKRSAVNGGEYTDLRMEWEEKVDDEVAGQLLAAVDVLMIGPQFSRQKKG